ncbi:hypothetical protein [Nonomuraea sp. NPDC046570]
MERGGRPDGAYDFSTDQLFWLVALPCYVRTVGLARLPGLAHARV